MLKIKFILSFLAFLASLSLWAQITPTHPYPMLDTVIGWGSGADRDDFRTRVAAIDNQGNIIISGLYTGITDMDPGPSTDLTQNSTGTGFYLQKLDSAGNYLWGRSWPENSFAIATSLEIDNFGNIFLGGYFGDAAFDVDPISTNFFIQSDSIMGRLLRTSFVMKIDSMGNQVWVKGISGAQLESMVLKQSVIAVSGDFNGLIDTTLQVNNPQYYKTNDNYDGAGLYVMRLDGFTGNNIDHVIIADTLIAYMNSNDISIDSQGNYFLAGSMWSGTFDFDPSINGTQRETTNPSSNQSYVLRLDSNLNYSAHMVLNAVSDNRLFRVNAVDSAIWIGGRYSNYQNMDLDPGLGVIVPSAGSSSTRDLGDFLLKLNQNFQLMRSFYFPLSLPEYNSPYFIFNGSSVYLASTYKREVSLTPQANNKTVLINNQSGNFVPDMYSFFVMKIDSRDSIEWIYHPQRFSNADTGRHRIGAMLWDNDELVLVGNYSGKVDFNLSPDTTQLQTQSGWSNFVLRLKDCSAPTNLQEINRKYDVCDTFTLAGNTLSTQGWHIIRHTLTTTNGCDSLIANDSVFVFLDQPTVVNNGTYLAAQYNNSLYGDWIDCATNSVVQNGGAQFYPQVPGSYALVYRHPNAPSCTDTLPCESINQIGLTEANPENWKVYPNPAQHILHIEGPFKDLKSVRILALNGQQLLTLDATSQVNISNLAVGLYLLELKTAKGDSRLMIAKE